MNLLHIYYTNIVLRNLRKNKGIVILKPDKRNRVVTLDQHLHNSTIQIISDTSKFEKLNEDPTLKQEASLQRFLCNLKQKNCLMKMYMINCILLVLLQLASMVLLKCISFPLVIHFLNFNWLFYLYALLITILPVFSVIFFHTFRRGMLSHPQTLTHTKAFRRSVINSTHKSNF